VKRDPKKKLEAEAMLAMAKARHRQDRRAVSYLIAMAVLVLGLGAISWFFWPVEPPRVALAAYDAVAVPEESIKLYGRAAPENRERALKLDGLDLWFQVPATQRSDTLVTDAGGSAALDWQAPQAKGERLEFMVRHQQKDEPKRGVRDNGRVFVWPAKSKLLVVDVDHALADGVEALADSGSAAPVLRPGAATALQALGARYKVVYLSAAANEPASYKKLRSWLPQARLPDGPLLSPYQPSGPGDVEVFTMGQIEGLKKRFSGPTVGIAGRDGEARMYADAGWKAVVIGDAEALPPGASAIASWEALPKELGP
jgi:hypothetical protein